MKRRLLTLLSLLLVLGLAPGALAANYVSVLTNVQAAVVGTSLEWQMSVWYVGTDVQGSSYSRTVKLIVLLTDQPVDIRTKVVDAIVAGAALVPNSSGGTGVTVARGGGLIPTFERGQ